MRMDTKTKSAVKQIWAQYDVDGNGYMNQEEVRHFCAKYLSETQGLKRLPEKTFAQWFKSIDKDGSGQIDMVEMALAIKSMARAFQ